MGIKYIVKKTFFKQYINYLAKKVSNLYDKDIFRNKLFEAEKQLYVNYNCNPVIVKQRSDIDPVISIITPTYNSAKFLNELRESLESQEIANKIQWVIVNDCSTDNTEEIFNEISGKTSLKSFKFINLDRNLGTSNALNIAADNSNAPILAWVSADDAYCDPKKLSTDLNMIENGYNCVFSRYVATGPDLKTSVKFDVLANKKIDSRENKDLSLFFLYRNLIAGNIFNGSSSVFKKDLFFKAGKFDTNLGIFDQDSDLWEKFLLSKAKIGLDQLCSFNRRHKAQNSNRLYEMMIFTNLVRIRLIKSILDMNLDEYIGYFEDRIKNDLLSIISYPISTSFFIKQSEKLKINSKFEYFSKNFINKIFGEENIALLEKISDKFIKTNSFQIFLRNIQ
ncbi:MAG: glycosyltransferase family 2 protein [Minisyncoccia bacterium]